MRLQYKHLTVMENLKKRNVGETTRNHILEVITWEPGRIAKISAITDCVGSFRE